MPEFTNVRLSPYYLNTRRLGLLGGVILPVDAGISLAKNSGTRAAGMRQASDVAEQILQSGKIENLTKIFSSQEVEGRRILGFIWGTFAFRGAASAVRQQQAGKQYKNGSFSGHVQIGDSEYDLSGEMSNDHYYSTTSLGMLRGRRRMLIAGLFEVHGKTVEVFPYIVGDVTSDIGSFNFALSSSIRVYPSRIDAFRKMSQLPAPDRKFIKLLSAMSEQDVKNAFADIIGEPFIQKDWGGEKSDLVTSRLTVDGHATSAAFIFKGPSVPGPMHPANMGKRGDQLIRAFDEPVELVIVQHGNVIASSVVRMAEALAYDLRHPKRYCIIDGADTTQILMAYDKLKSV